MSKPLPIFRQGDASALPRPALLFPTPAAITNRPALPVSAALPWSRAERLLTFALLFLAVLMVQSWMGALQVERGLYSDDAAHFMNGLLIRDYLTHALGSDPMRFAEQYYLHYPKIAPLMWPPLFHVLFGLSLLLGFGAASTALFLVGLATAWTAYRLHVIVRQTAGSVLAFVAAGLFLTTPLVMTMTSVVMLDVMIAALSIEAAYWLARFVSSQSWRHAAAFGGFAAAACLTKGNGVAVVLIPLLLMAIVGRFDLLRRSGLYVAAAIVLVAAVPVLAVSASFDAGIGDFGPVTSTEVLDRTLLYGAYIWKNTGAGLLGLAAIGGAVAAARARRRRPEAVPLVEALLALLGATVLFHLFNPHLASAGRYLTMAIAPVIAIAMTGVVELRSLRGAPGRLAATAIIALVILVSAAGREVVPLVPLGYRTVVAQLAAADQLAGRRLLVISDEIGEGAAVTETAVLGLEPVPTIVRGSKLLAHGNWVGHDRLVYDSPMALMQDLEDLHVTYVLLDRSAASSRLIYFSQIAALTDTQIGRLERIRVDSAGSASRPLELYRVIHSSPGPPKSLRIGLQYTLGRTVEQ